MGGGETCAEKWAERVRPPVEIQVEPGVVPGVRQFSVEEQNQGDASVEQVLAPCNHLPTDRAQERCGVLRPGSDQCVQTGYREWLVTRRFGDIVALQHSQQVQDAPGRRR